MRSVAVGLTSSGSRKRALTLNRAVVELLEHGLKTIAGDQPLTELERTLTVCAVELEKTRARVREAELCLQAARGA